MSEALSGLWAAKSTQKSAESQEKSLSVAVHCICSHLQRWNDRWNDRCPLSTEKHSSLFGRESEHHKKLETRLALGECTQSAAL